MNRVEAIEFAKEQQEIFGGRMGEFLKFVEDELAQLPSAPRWIPCKERLPECGNKVLVTDIYAGVTIAMIVGGGWEAEYGQWSSIDCVSAWMPLPDPWKGE